VRVRIWAAGALDIAAERAFVKYDHIRLSSKILSFFLVNQVDKDTPSE